MDFFVTSDANWETGLSKLVSGFNNNAASDFFDKKNYGSSLTGLSIVLMCRDPNLVFKQRIRFSKYENILYADLMFDYNQFVDLNLRERQKVVAGKIRTEIPSIIMKYKFKDFNLPEFEKDTILWLTKINWL